MKLENEQKLNFVSVSHIFRKHQKNLCVQLSQHKIKSRTKKASICISRVITLSFSPSHTVIMTSSPASSITPESIFIPIDLEASLGRIEEMSSECIGANMDCDDQQKHWINPPPPPPPFRNTRTSSRTPFTPRDDTIAPYPISETDAEIRERQRLEESVGSNWTLVAPYTGSNDDCSMMEVTATDSPLNDDDFSLTDDGTDSLIEAQEDFPLERIDDPISFWEENIPITSTPTDEQTSSQQQHQHNLHIPYSVSFSSHAELSMEW